MTDSIPSSNPKELNVECAYCGIKFHKKPSAVKNSKSGLFFCSREHQGYGFTKDSHVPITSGPTTTVVRSRGKAKFACKDCDKPRYLENLTEGRCYYCHNTFNQVQLWLAGDISVTYAGVLQEPKSFVKAYLVLTRGDKCEKCGFDTKKANGDSVIQMNHIDGNYLNNAIENLELLCPNDHSLTETWGSQNTSMGRRRMAKILKEAIST